MVLKEMMERVNFVSDDTISIDCKDISDEVKDALITLVEFEYYDWYIDLINN